MILAAIKKIIIFLFLPLLLFSQTPYFDKSTEGYLVFHPIKTDEAQNIVPWYGSEPGEAYNFVINTVWSFWDTMRIDMNGLPYYMNHQVWRPGINDRRGIGGDQLAMVLYSGALLYQYTGNEKIKENMKFIADYYLTHALSPGDAQWPNIPFPYNTFIYSGIYDGDMVLGKGFAQPDKAGSFGDELITLYKMTNNHGYLEAAVNIANTLARHTRNGDNDNSPLPFKVNVYTGEIGKLKSNIGDHSDVGLSSYTTNWVGALQLLEKLETLNAGDAAAFRRAADIILEWMKQYPLKTNKWGPFFEDIQKAIDHPGWGQRNNPQMEKRLATLLRAWRQTQRPVIHVRHYSREPLSTYRPGQEGNEFKPEVMPAENEWIIEKQTNSAFIGTELEKRLRAAGIVTLVVTGVIANNLVEATVQMTGNLGFVQARHPGTTHFEMEKTGQPSRWNMLRALRVLKCL